MNIVDVISLLYNAKDKAPHMEKSFLSFYQKNIFRQSFHDSGVLKRRIILVINFAFKVAISVVDKYAMLVIF